MSSSEVQFESLSVANSKEEHAVCCLSVPNSLLYKWHYKTKRQGTLYVDLLNGSIIGHAIRIRSDRIEGRLRRQASQVKSRVEKGTRRGKEKTMREVYYMTVIRDDKVLVDKVEEELTAVKDSIENFRFVEKSSH